MTPVPHHYVSAKKRNKLLPAKVNQPQNGIKNKQTVIENISHFHYVMVKRIK